MVWRLSPSDLTFLFDECPACFRAKIADRVARPSVPFPKIFTQIHNALKMHFDGQRDIIPELAGGAVAYAEQWVMSTPLSVPGHTSKIVVKGRFDTVMEFDDGTFGVVDFKTANVNPNFVEFYGRQLHAYAHALEQSARNEPIWPVTRLGLLCVELTAMQTLTDGSYAYVGAPTWVEIPRDDEKFFSFLGEVLDVLESDIPPAPSSSCSFCRYRESA